jgi:serine/threonine-protein kinase HipA
MFFNRVLFDYLIGNCDNHLKNHSFLWSSDWSGLELSPLYDITCTTFYPELDREMGVSLCESRRIDDVKKADIVRAARAIGISEDLGWSQYLELSAQLPGAIKRAENDLVTQGFAVASHIADFIFRDSSMRRSL